MSGEHTVPEKSVTEYSPDELNFWIPFFVSEIRRKNGEYYRAKSLFEFILCIQSLFVVKKNITYRFLKEDVFSPIRNSLDNMMKRLQRLGFGNDPKKVDVITPLMEEELWTRGILGDSSCRQLLSTLVFVLGINLGLRTGEHRKLRRDMFEVRVFNFFSVLTFFHEIYDFFYSD